MQDNPASQEVRVGVPKCHCHGEPMYWQKDKRLRAGGYWHCAVRHLELNRRYFHELSGPAYNHRLLQMRRASALHDRRKRKEKQHGEISPEG